MSAGKNHPLRVAVWQAAPGGRLDEIELQKLEAASPDVVALPEYFWVRPEDTDLRAASRHWDEDRRRLEELSRRVAALWVGGTAVEPAPGDGFFNTCLVYDGGREVGRYRKRHLMPGEEKAGVVPGTEPALVEARGLRLGLLICADVLHRESYGELAAYRPHLIAVPTNSPFRPVDPIEEKLGRDQAYFVAGARLTGAWVIKACTVGRLFGRPVQGRSLVAGPHGVLARVPHDQEQDTLVLLVDLRV